MLDSLISYTKALKDMLANMKKDMDIRGILYLYRYISWFSTCLFYLFAQTNAPIILRLGVIIALFGAAKIITDIYIKFSKSFRTLEIAILIETLGITLLLIPTGGLNSPFIWYALNPVLAAASFLPIYFCWFNLLFYLVSASIISFDFFRDFMTISEMIQNYAYFILVFVLITFIVQMLSRLTKRLNNQTNMLKKQGQELETMNAILKKSNSRYKESIDHIMSLYQMVETFHMGGNMDSICSTFAQYASKLTKSDIAFLWTGGGQENKAKIWVYRNTVIDIDEQLADYLSKQWDIIKNQDKLIELNIGGIKFLVMNIKSPSRNYGLIGIQAGLDNQSDKLYLKQLSFLSDLLGAVLDSRHLKGLEDQLLIIEEQNRIANEIHDSVSQRLFSIVCGIAAITKKWDRGEKELQEHFELIRKSADLAMKELRSSIYQLSSRKKGERPFAQMLKEYLDNFAKLHSIEINTSISGNEELVSPQLKKALYRIICEGTGNAVKHGQCKRIKVILKLESPNIVLSIEDDGKGFDINDASKADGSGLGIRNMRNLVLTFNGNMDIESEMDRKTKVIVSIPVHREYINIMEESVI